MRVIKISLLLTVLSLAMSCSKKDDVKPQNTDLDQASLSFSSDAQVITVPTAMTTSDDPQASLAASWVSSVNAMTGQLSYMKAPANATKSSTRITASNGRTAASGDVVVYIWKDGQNNSIAFQKSETTDSYVFEIFLMYSGTTNWLKYFHAEETKDHSAGSMAVLDIFGYAGSDKTFKIFDYTWKRSNDILTFTMTDHTADFVVTITINEKTKAGSIVAFFEGVKESEMTWDAKGNGTWKDYDNDGNITDEGTWTV